MWKAAGEKVSDRNVDLQKEMKSTQNATISNCVEWTKKREISKRDLLPGTGRLRPTGSVQPATCLCAACELRMVFTSEYLPLTWW